MLGFKAPYPILLVQIRNEEIRVILCIISSMYNFFCV